MLTLDSRVGCAPGQTRAERALQLAKMLRSLGVPTTIKDMEFGDAAFDGFGPKGEVRVGIELKSATGLVGDLLGGRFVAHQIPGLQKDYQYRYLVIEGTFRPSMSDGMLEVPRSSTGWGPTSPRIMYVDLMKLLDDIDLRAGFHIRRTYSTVETMHLLAAEYSGWRKAWDAHKGLKRFHEDHGGVVLMRRPSLTRLWARDLPGIGWERSEALERKFKTPKALAEAGLADLASVEGIGKITASKVWKAIRGLK